MSKANDLANINSPTVGLSATTGGASVALGGCGDGVMVTNLGQYPVWCCTGVTAPTAVATTGSNCCVAPGTTQTFQMDRQHAYFGAISTGGTSLLSISAVNGV